mmetsp:Transcript_20957/g.58600  ORF Transcript_20957/g.58600 Transcript_20957/m.58600 type:complete len:499 (+) Transcript_20957:86-1582(+)
MARLVARWKTKAPADWSAGLEPPTAYEETVREEAHFLPRGLTAVRSFDTSKGPIVDPPSLVYEPPLPLLRFASDISLAGRAPEWPPLFFALEGPPLLLARPNSSCAASSSSSSDAASLPVLVATAASGFAPNREPEGWGGPCWPPSLEPSLSSTAVAASILVPFSADASPDSMQSLPRRVRPSSAKATKHGRSVRDVNEPVVYEDDSSANDSVNDADDVEEWVRYAGEASKHPQIRPTTFVRLGALSSDWITTSQGTSSRPTSPAHNRQQRSAVAHRHEQPTSAAARAQLVELNARPPSKPPSRRGRRTVGLSGGVGDRPMGATLVAGPPASASAPLVARPSQPAAAAAAVFDSLRLPRARAGVLAAALDVAVALEASKPQVPHRSNGAGVRTSGGAGGGSRAAGDAFAGRASARRRPPSQGPSRRPPSARSCGVVPGSCFAAHSEPTRPRSACTRGGIPVANGRVIERSGSGRGDALGSEPRASSPPRRAASVVCAL